VASLEIPNIRMVASNGRHDVATPMAGVVALRHCATEERLHEFLKRDVTDFG
jgi:hypothetical protein